MATRGTRYWNSGSIPLIGPDILGDIIATLADLAIVISSDAEILTILSNPIHRGYTDLHRWERSDLRDFLTVESVPKFERALATYLEDASATRPVELNHRDPDSRWEFPINYTMHRIGPDNTILMLGARHATRRRDAAAAGEGADRAGEGLRDPSRARGALPGAARARHRAHGVRLRRHRADHRVERGRRGADGPPAGGAGGPGLRRRGRGARTRRAHGRPGRRGGAAEWRGRGHGGPPSGAAWRSSWSARVSRCMCIRSCSGRPASR